MCIIYINMCMIYIKTVHNIYKTCAWCKHFEKTYFSFKQILTCGTNKYFSFFNCFSRSVALLIKKLFTVSDFFEKTRHSLPPTLCITFLYAKFRLKAVRSKLSILLETTEGFYFHWRGFKSNFFQFKTLRMGI